nr:MAG TPA_asm: hypothetical protein [Caudoviricetes sp.]
MSDKPKKYTFKPRSKKRVHQLALQDAMRCAGCQVPPYFLPQTTRTRVVGLYILAINTISNLLSLDIKKVNDKLINKYHYLARGGKYKKAKRVGSYQDEQIDKEGKPCVSADNAEDCDEETLRYPWGMSACAPGAPPDHRPNDWALPSP